MIHHLNSIIFLVILSCSLLNEYNCDHYYQQHVSTNYQKIIPSLKGIPHEDLNQKQKSVEFKRPIERPEYVFTKEKLIKETPTVKTDHQRIQEHNLNQKIYDHNQHHQHQQNQKSVLDNINRIKELNKYSEEIAKDIENYDLKFNRPNIDEFRKNEVERENALPEVNLKSYPINTTNPLLPDLPDITNCPVCFKLVKEQVIEEYGMLKKLTDQLEYIKNYPEVIQDLSFQFKLRELASLVDSMLKDARYSQMDEHNIIKSIQDLKDRISKLTTIRNQITQLPEIERQLIYSASNMTIIDDIIKQIQSGVDNSRKFLDNQGVYALQKAWERSSKFSRQSDRLTEIAKEARHLSDEHYLDAGEVFKIATKSLNTSQSAFSLAKDAISTQEGYKNAMERLRKQWINTQNLIVKISKIAEDSHREALKAYNDSLDLYSKIGLNLPLSRSDRINQDVNWIINQAMRMMSEVDKLLEKYEVTINGSLNKLEDARNLLKQAQQLQAVTNQLLKETQEGYDKALAAFESGELTLSDAKNTLRILREFDSLVAKSKLKAEEALKKVEEIHSLIKEAEMKTEDAERALKGSLQEALDARDLALEAMRLTEKASIQVRKIKEQAFAVKNKGIDLRKRVDLFNLKIEECVARVVQFEGEGEKDGKKVKDILEKANHAKISANDAMKKIESAINSLDSILDELKNIQQIDPSLLEELFQLLAKAEQEYKEADLDNRTNILNDAKEQQRIWIIDYERLIAKLQTDVNNIDKIRQAIPDKCFRRLRLEP